MMKEKNKETNNEKKPVSGWNYVIAAYVTFAAMVLGICGCASMVFHASPLVMRILSNLCAWSPTIVLFVNFKKWCPEKTRKGFFQEIFAGKIKISLILASILSTGVAFLVAVYVFSCIKGTSITTVFQSGSFPIIVSIILSVLSGPTGEECGWRGYLRPVFESKYGFVKGNMMTGLVWTFWHTVLWFVDSDYTSGTEMLIYILSNIVVITAIHMIMAVILEKENNLIYAILVHLFFNLPYTFIHVDIVFYIIIIVVYTIEVIAFLLYRKLTTHQ